MTITIGPLGILGLISAMVVLYLFVKPVKRSGDFDFYSGLPEAITFLGIVIFWVAIGVAKVFSRLGWLVLVVALMGCAGVKKVHRAIVPKEPPVLILPTGFPGIQWVYDVRRNP